MQRQVYSQTSEQCSGGERTYLLLDRGFDPLHAASKLLFFLINAQVSC